MGPGVALKLFKPSCDDGHFVMSCNSERCFHVSVLCVDFH